MYSEAEYNTGYVMWTGAEREQRILRTRDATPGRLPQCPGARFLIPSDQEVISDWLVQLPFSKVWQLTCNLEPFWLIPLSNYSVTIKSSPHGLVPVQPTRILATSQNNTPSSPASPSRDISQAHCHLNTSPSSKPGCSSSVFFFFPKTKSHYVSLGETFYVGGFQPS